MSLASRPVRPATDRMQRYFLPGSGRALSFPIPGGQHFVGIEAPPLSAGSIAAFEAADNAVAFIELDLRSDWEREELKGAVRRRTDFFPGGLKAQSEIDYDRAGRRSEERLYDESTHLALRRAYQPGPAATPAMISLLDATGATLSATCFDFNGNGLPIEEEQLDQQGLPLLHRSYRFDASGRIVSFHESQGASIRGLGITWAYDSKGRIKERRLVPFESLDPVRLTLFNCDWESGALAERTELVENLPLTENHIAGESVDVRLGFRYRIRFDGEGARFFSNPADDSRGDAYPSQTRRQRFAPPGWLEEEDREDKDGFALGREMWRWDGQDRLVEHEAWDGGGRRLFEQFRYEVDSQGNWVKRWSLGNPEPEERRFEYYADDEVR